MLGGDEGVAHGAARYSPHTPTRSCTSAAWQRPADEDLNNVLFTAESGQRDQHARVGRVPRHPPRPPVRGSHGGSAVSKALASIAVFGGTWTAGADRRCVAAGRRPARGEPRATASVPEGAVFDAADAA